MVARCGRGTMSHPSSAQEGKVGFTRGLYAMCFSSSLSEKRNEGREVEATAWTLHGARLAILLNASRSLLGNVQVPCELIGSPVPFASGRLQASIKVVRRSC